MRTLSLLLACVLATGCMGIGGDDDDTDPTPTPTATPTPTPTPSPTPSPTPPTNATPTPPTNATPTPPTNATPTPPTPPTPPAPVAINIAGFAFAPASVTVPVGTNVTWTNNEALPTVTHTATADDGSFDSGNLAVGASYSFVFNATGTFAYKCDLHPVMTGTITVA